MTTQNTEHKNHKYTKKGELNSSKVDGKLSGQNRESRDFIVRGSRGERNLADAIEPELSRSDSCPELEAQRLKGFGSKVATLKSKQVLLGSKRVASQIWSWGSI